MTRLITPARVPPSAYPAAPAHEGRLAQSIVKSFADPSVAQGQEQNVERGSRHGGIQGKERQCALRMAQVRSTIV